MNDCSESLELYKYSDSDIIVFIDGDFEGVTIDTASFQILDSTAVVKHSLSAIITQIIPVDTIDFETGRIYFKVRISVDQKAAVSHGDYLKFYAKDKDSKTHGAEVPLVLVCQ